MAIAIQIKGLASVDKFLKNTNKEVLNNANNAVVKAGFYIQAEVQESIAGRKSLPRTVDTGRFLNSVKAEQKQPLTSTIATNVSYAKNLEYGTSRMRARPHFRNTAVQNTKKVRDFIEKEIKKV